MSTDLRRQFFTDKGLPPSYVDAAENFLSAVPPVRQVFQSPAGYGKTTLLLSIVEYVVSQGGRVLLLADSSTISDHHVSVLGQAGVSVLRLDRPAMRDLLAGSAIPRVHLPTSRAYATTTHFAAAEDVKPNLLGTRWDLVAMDDYEETELIRELARANVYQRLLITFDPSQAIYTVPRLPDDATLINLIPPTRPQQFKISIIPFERGEHEIQITQQLERLAAEVSKIPDLKRGSFIRTARQAIQSSYFELEQPLARLRQAIVLEQNKLAPSREASANDTVNLVAALDIVDELLVQLDELDADSKQLAYEAFVDRSHHNHVITYTSSKNSTQLLQESLSRQGLRCLDLRPLDREDFSAKLTEYREKGGVAFVSGPGAVTGLRLGVPNTMLIMYDVPTSGHELFALLSLSSPLHEGRIHVLSDNTDKPAFRTLVGWLG